MQSCCAPSPVSETRAFMKAVIAVESERIFGFTMFGNEAGEVSANCYAGEYARWKATDGAAKRLGLRGAILACSQSVVGVRVSPRSVA